MTSALRSILVLVLTACALFASAAVAQDTPQVTEQSNEGILGDDVDLESLGDAVDLSEATGDVIEDIRILGLGRTSEAVITRELLFKVGDRFDPGAFDESVQLLKNLGIFRDVRARVTRAPDGAGLITWIVIYEKWTTIPIVRFGGGGGSNFFIVGVYDPNSFGQYLELGGQYQNDNLDTHSGVIWMREPRLAGERLKLSVDLWYQNLVRPFYNSEADLIDAYNQQRFKARATLDLEVHRFVRIGAGSEVDQDSFNIDNLNDEQREAHETTGAALPDGGRTVFAELRLILGRIDQDEFLLQGVEMVNAYRRGTFILGSELDLNLVESQTLAYLKLPWRSNLAGRLSVGHTNSDAAQHQFFIGGLDFMRGFLDAQLSGPNFWQANAEIRVPSVDNSWLVLQHAAFVDVGDAAGSFGDLATFERRPRTSVGGGVRLLSPRIYRATLRVDYAVAFGGTTTQGISFSAAQFF